ncbi:MAG TPA: sugar phosphate isomerase/epimerase family protein [Candidatus Limnocylindrales bacterium]|jgi:sugar phosphate isomerase/epimerase|nr:sugar phosphate isomerase/epimerase family protein [Candidatus Limnocylindrales bacterium]
MNRRDALLALSTAGSALWLGRGTTRSDESVPRTRMGIVTYAFGIHQKNKWAGRHEGLPAALALLEESHRLGAAGIQVELTTAQQAHAVQLRRRAEEYGMFIEATFSAPQSADDVDRFEKDIQTAKAAGATLARTAILPGRRYEQFKSLAEFKQAEKHGLQALEWAEPVLARQRFYLAVENHKDQRIEEKLETIKRVGSEFIGICVDVGNSFTLLEDPLETVRAFAPWALTVHFKDQAVRESETGFWFADVALGEGFIDLPAIVKVLRDAKPRIHFNLETITRDALSVPVLTKDFWVTMPDIPATQLARTLAVVKSKSTPKVFVKVSELPVDQQLALELGNVQRSLVYARERLSLS